MASIEVKVRKLDGELARYKEQMSKMRPGPGKVPILISSGMDESTEPSFTLALSLALLVLDNRDTTHH